MIPSWEKGHTMFIVHRLLNLFISGLGFIMQIVRQLMENVKSTYFIEDVVTECIFILNYFYRKSRILFAHLFQLSYTRRKRCSKNHSLLLYIP